MFARVELVTRPSFQDPTANGLLRKLQLAHPGIHGKIQEARWVDAYWMELPWEAQRIHRTAAEVFLDPVLSLMLDAGSDRRSLSSILDEMCESSAGVWLGLERRYRPGVTDNVGRSALEAFEIVSEEKLGSSRIASGGILLLRTTDPLLPDDISAIAKDVLCNELIEAWRVLEDSELREGRRFEEAQVREDLPSVALAGSDQIEWLELEGLSDPELKELSRNRLWALSLEEMKAIRAYRSKLTDVEMEILAQTWSEHCKHKIFAAEIDYEDSSRQEDSVEIPSRIDHLFKTTIAGTTAKLKRDWLLSVFHDNAGIVAFDEEHAFCIKAETHNSPSALDPYGGALTGIVGVNRDILGCGLGAKPVFNTDVFCTATPDYSKPLPDRLLHPRRILDGIRRGVEHGGNKSGIPTVNGALVFDERYLGKPLVYCGTGGWMPRKSAGRDCQTKEVKPGDRICMVGGRIGKDGIHGATFSSLALDEKSPVTAVQLGDPITQKRMADFLLEARDLGLYRAITDNGAGGLSSSVGEMAGLSGGASLDVALAKTKYPGLKPFELVVSESQERMTVAVPPEKMQLFTALAERRGVEVSDLGSFTKSGVFEVLYQGKSVAKLDLEFLHQGVPRLKLKALWNGRPSTSKSTPIPFEQHGAEILKSLLSRPNIASKEWLIRQYDHEVQGTSVVKPLHASGAQSGPNDAGVIRPKPTSQAGIAVGCGILPRLSDIDAYLMAQASVDEAVRNVIAVGAEFGEDESVLALVDNFCWPDPVKDPTKAAALVRACFGMQEAALALGAPLVSGKDSMKNDYRGKLQGKEVQISVPPTLLMTAVARVPDVRGCRTSDFKRAGDVIYVLGGTQLGLAGSELEQMVLDSATTLQQMPAGTHVPKPDWTQARTIYSWLSRCFLNPDFRLESLHDVSDGGVLTAISEGLLARGLGARVRTAEGREPWEFFFGEGFHSFVATASEATSTRLEAEWLKSEVPFFRIGEVTESGKLELEGAFTVDVTELRKAWRKEGYWE